MICLYNILDNFDSKYLLNIQENHDICSPFMGVLNDHERHSPYIIQIAISFVLMICEKMLCLDEHRARILALLTTHQVHESLEKISNSSLGQQNEQISKMIMGFMETYGDQLSGDDSTINIGEVTEENK